MKRSYFTLLFILIIVSASCYGQSTNDTIPPAVLNKFRLMHPHAIHIDYVQGSGEPIEHDLPDGYFKGRTYYNFEFEDGNKNENLYYDSLGNIMLTELNMYPDSLPQKIIDFFDGHFLKYKIEDGSMKEYSSVDNSWYYVISISFANNKREAELTFDHYGNFIYSDFPPLPDKIKSNFDLQYRDAEDIIWDTIAYPKDYKYTRDYSYKIYFHNQDEMLSIWCDSIGNNWTDPDVKGAYVPNNVLAKFSSIFPDGEGHWMREEKSPRNFIVEFPDIHDTTTGEESTMMLDSLCNIIKITHAVNFDSVLQKAKTYVKSHYEKYSIEYGTTAITDSTGKRSYIVEVRNKDCESGNCGYWLYFDKKENS